MRETFQPTVYVLASGKCGTLHIGVTSDLMKRLWQHRTNAVPGFTSSYDVHRLVWFESHNRNARRHPSRETVEEMESRLEAQPDRAGQPGMA